METKTGSALVIGAGIGGIRSALDLAEMNYRVFLIDKAPHLGGILSGLDYQFPNDHCGMCKMLPTLNRDSSSQFCLRKGLFHENIEIMPATEMVAMEGEPGKFQVTLLSAPSFIDADKCTGCGECSTVCPVEAPDAFNGGLTRRKAVYLPVPHNIPNRFVIDAAACTRCGECEKVCPTGAINLRLDARRAFRVLVVDDELVVRDSLKEWLDVEGYSVDAAGSGREAIELLSKNEYSLMLLDIKMPGMDGVEVLKVAKEMREDLPVVMMTAYATVETAVEAMKIGARDYLMKPFDIEVLLSKVAQRYESTVQAAERKIEVGAVIMAAGCSFSDPSEGVNTYEYGVLPNILTSVQFERLVSGTGPNGGKLLRPSDGKPAEKIAWLQCVGSRNIRENADYCSSVCCMFSIKEALLAKARTGGAADTAIFYMDMRTFGKDFQRYRDAAERESGVRFVRSRVHSVEPAGDGCLRLHYSDNEGQGHDERFDLVVLAAGQRPSDGCGSLAEISGFDLDSSGFCRTDGLFTGRTSREGVFAGGSFAGLKDISESVIQAGAASFEASRLIHSKGGSLSATNGSESGFREVSRELPRAAVVLCTCGKSGDEAQRNKTLAERLSGWNSVADVLQIEMVCTQQGWDALAERLAGGGYNRVVIGACMPYVYRMKLPALGRRIGLFPALMDVVDIRTPAFPRKGLEPDQALGEIEASVKMSLERLKNTEPSAPETRHMVQKALVVGGGVAGMTAALAIADHGYKVDLVEKSGELGGLARLVGRTLDGSSTADILDKMVARIEANPNITVHRGAEVIHSQGLGGDFLTTIELGDGRAEILSHGVAILATGGQEALTDAYCHGKSESVLTQLEFEERLRTGAVDPAKLAKVVMIQCVGSREEGRQYCSRVCCASALKNALHVKGKNPETEVYVLYRDIMAYGFLEAYYTRARREGIIFMQYDPDKKPEVSIENGNGIRVSARDHILCRDIVIEPDVLVLSTGMVPAGNDRLAGLFGIELNPDGFLVEAEYKWQPVDSRKQGVFICGAAHSPRSIAESIAMAQAAAQRSLAMLSRQEMPVSNRVAEVRHSLCSLCERCIAACPYGARFRNDEEDRIEVDGLACQGCGSCAAVCPNSASVLRGMSDRQVFAMLDAALE